MKRTIKIPMPKGAYQLPGGNFATDRIVLGPDGKQYKITTIHKAEIDLHEYARALINIAVDEARPSQASTNRAAQFRY